jgi:hypothetical protein
MSVKLEAFMLPAWWGRAGLHSLSNLGFRAARASCRHKAAFVSKE